MRTEDIDLAAAIVASTGHQPTLSKTPSRHLQTFTFPDDAPIMAAAARFASGELVISAKHLLSCRSMLYRQMRGAR
ncbi:hypothetical protein GMST_32910 [Geomonas silvestris]|uniref:DUF5659 domain-containing protein n=1 Tax=Geomonas silvestris TaxID=2740184 RepID=A0A6V8MLT8_9BACT|nr:hypothetical protein GMST_32910 [Geomonas silvestris]